MTAVSKPALFLTVHRANSMINTVNGFPSDMRNSPARPKTLSTSLSSDITSSPAERAEEWKTRKTWSRNPLEFVPGPQIGPHETALRLLNSSVANSEEFMPVRVENLAEADDLLVRSFAL